jgi:hypothetical protein
MIKMRRIDVAYTDGHWLAQIDTDCLPLDGPTLIQLIKEVQGALPDEALLFVVDYTTIEYYFEAEAQFLDASEKSDVLVCRNSKGTRGDEVAGVRRFN